MATIDDQICATIDAIRAANGACTAGAVATELKVSKTWVVQRCELMRLGGRVTWTSMAGSLRVVTSVTTDTTVLTASPLEFRSVVSTHTVTKPGGVATPDTASPVSDVDNGTDQVIAGESVSGNSVHNVASGVPPRNSSRRKRPSGT